MQVSHVENAKTHAIMGGGEARAFGMSQSAEFFTVLSDTLYRDKKRAVIREVVCNAWDAHIMTGKTDVPVEITLTDEELVIKDVGPGIADDRIVDIYCVYGNSTKVQDENQTGGFGLGSKAPFAYSDHFSVTSCHDGIKNIYAISRGGAETKGVPDMRTMVSVPTTETGLTVTLPVRSREDALDFEGIIKSVAHQGGMLVTLNGVELERRDYTEARKSGYLVTTKSNGLGESTIYLLYGTVLYPITSTDAEVNTAANQISEMIPNTYRTILIAPPNSVGVTPSREALSYTDKTIATIKELTDKMARRVKARIGQANNLLLDQAISPLSDEERFHLINFEYYRQPFDNLPMIHEATDPLDVAKIVAAATFRDRHNTEKTVRVVGRAAAKRWRDDRRLLRRAFLAGWKPSGWAPRRDYFEMSLSRMATRKIMRATARHDLLNSLYFVHGMNARDIKSGKIREARITSEPQRTVVIAQSRPEALAHLRTKLTYFPDHDYDEKVFFCVSVPRSKATLRASLTAELENLGFDVETVKAPIKRKPKVEKPNDKFIPLKEFSVGDAGFMDIPHMQEPKYYVDLNVTIDRLREAKWFDAFRYQLCNEFEDIAVVRGPSQVKRARTAGAEDLIEILMKRLQKKAKLREGKIAALMKAQRVAKCARSYWHRAISQAEYLVDYVPMVFFEFVPVRVADKQAVIDTCKLLKIMEDFFGGTDQPQDYPFKTSFFAELRETAFNEFDKHLLGEDEFEHTWRHLDLVDANRARPHDPEPLIKILRAVKVTTPMPVKGANK